MPSGGAILSDPRPARGLGPVLAATRSTSEPRLAVPGCLSHLASFARPRRGRNRPSLTMSHELKPLFTGPQASLSLSDKGRALRLAAEGPYFGSGPSEKSMRILCLSHSEGRIEHIRVHRGPQELPAAGYFDPEIRTR